MLFQSLEGTFVHGKTLSALGLYEVTNLCSNFTDSLQDVSLTIVHVLHTQGLIELHCLSSVAEKKQHLCSNFNFIHYMCTDATHFIVQVHCRTFIEALVEQHIYFLIV